MDQALCLIHQYGHDLKKIFSTLFTSFIYIKKSIYHIQCPRIILAEHTLFYLYHWIELNFIFLGLFQYIIEQHINTNLLQVVHDLRNVPLFLFSENIWLPPIFFKHLKNFYRSEFLKSTGMQARVCANNFEAIQKLTFQICQNYKFLCLFYSAFQSLNP